MDAVSVLVETSRGKMDKLLFAPDMDFVQRGAVPPIYTRRYGQLGGMALQFALHRGSQMGVDVGQMV